MLAKIRFPPIQKPYTTYILFPLLLDPTSDPKKPLDVYDCVVCVYAVVAGEKAYPIADYPIAERSCPIDNFN
ncbi:11505_t:CDS:2 [Rhizophagus irregularis]|nr:11505_t:CDS:2 [Rhizophagus irregularis]